MKIFAPKREKEDAGSRIMESFMILLFAKQYWSYKVKDDDVSGISSSNGTEEKCTKIIPEKERTTSNT
jgi:hypothetical protein